MRLLIELHTRLLGRIRSEGAGRVRSKSWGAEYLEFGPNRSAHRDDVGRAIEAVLDIARRRGADLTAASDVADSVQLAVWLHAEVIRIHPFFDGNGRTSRFFMNIVLEATGVGCVAVEVVKKEYTEALNTYFAATPRGATPESLALGPLVALVLECYGWQAPR